MAGSIDAFSVILPFLRPIEHLIRDETISDILVQPGAVFVDRNGVLSREPICVETADLTIAVQNIASELGKEINEQQPLLDARLPDGSRVAAVYAPVALGGPNLTIRKFGPRFNCQQLIDQGCLPVEVFERVRRASREQRNILVSGGTGSGKTTLVNAFLMDLIQANERLLVIEKPAELRLQHPNCLRWEAVDAASGQPEITVGQLVRAAMRHRPDRIVIGEVRDASAYDLLQALNSGHSSSFSTIHADGALPALRKMAAYAIGARPNLDHEYIRQETADAFHLVVHIGRFVSGIRRVIEAFEVTGYDSVQKLFQGERVYQFAERRAPERHAYIAAGHAEAG